MNYKNKCLDMHKDFHADVGNNVDAIIQQICVGSNKLNKFCLTRFFMQ